MDYRGYENKFNEIKKNITDFLMTRNQKVLDYANGTVKSYLDLLDKNDISIKSFKLKIIHSEQTCKKNILEFEQMLSEKTSDIKMFLDTFFLDYDKNTQNYRFFQNRKSDLLMINSHLKRKRQDALVRINNYQKDLSIKNKEKDALVNEKTKNHNQFIAELNRRLAIDLQRCLDNCTKEYLPLERELLDVDESSAINNIKDKIKSIRINSLDKQAELKNKYYLTVKEEDVKFLTDKEQIELEHERFKEESDIKVLECKKNIQLYQLEENRNSFEYDYNKDIQAITEFKKYANEYLEYLTRINSDIVNNLDDSYDFEFLSNVKINKTAISFYKFGFFNPVIKIMEGLKNIINVINEEFSKYALEYKNLRNTMYSQISNRLDRIDEVVFKNKKTTLDDYAETIDNGLNNLYLDQYLSEEKKCLMKFVNEVLDIIIEITNNLNKDLNDQNLNKKDFDFDNILIDRKEFCSDSDEYDEKLCAINENIKALKNDIEIYCDLYVKKRDKEKYTFSAEEKNKKQKIEGNFNSKVEIANKEIKKTFDSRNQRFQMEMKNISQTYIKNHKETDEKLKYYKNIL
mgnify:CR=1 FL=1